MKISIFSGTENRTYNNDITQTYTKQTSDYYDELTNSGMKKYSKDEFNRIQSTFTAPIQGAQSKSLENNIDLEFPARATSITLWTLKSVTHLGMFMTKTESEKLFRDSIIEELRILVLKK